MKKSKSKFNIIDAFIIILVVICLVGIYFRGRIFEKIGIEKNIEEYKISFSVSNIRHTSGKYITNGNVIYLDNAKTTLGSIDGNCTVVPAEISVTGSDGVPVVVNYPQDTFVDIAGVIKCFGIEKEDGFYLNGAYSLTPGMTVPVHTELLDFSITVTNITKSDA